MTATSGLGQVNATQEQLNAMAQRCQDTGDGLSRGMAQLLDRIQSLGGAGMRGTANNALQDVSVELNSGLTTILNALNELAGKMSNASTQFGLNDDEAAQDIRAAAGDAGGSSVVNALRG